MSVYTFLGTTDEISACDCCGRTGLKSTVALRVDDGDPVYFGVTCASRAIGRPVAEIKREAKRADEAVASAARALAAEAAAIEDRRWQAFLDVMAPEFSRSFMGGPDRFRQLEALGGYTAARASFMANPE